MEIMSQLEQWVRDKIPAAGTEETFAKEQQWIGWDRMMDGWLTRRWQDHQEKSGSMQNHRNQAYSGWHSSSRNCGMCPGICGIIATRNCMPEWTSSNKSHTPW